MTKLVEKFERETVERELRKAQTLKEEYENFKLRMEMHKSK